MKMEPGSQGQQHFNAMHSDSICHGVVHGKWVANDEFLRSCKWKKNCDKPGYWDVSWFRVAKPRSTSITSSSTVSSILAGCLMFPAICENLSSSPYGCRTLY
jgi:hypothetical protein